MALAWDSKSEWGSDGNTHYGDSGEWKFAIDKPRASGPWVIRGWKNGDFAAYKEAKTLTAAKAIAEGLIK